MSRKGESVLRKMNIACHFAAAAIAALVVTEAVAQPITPQQHENLLRLIDLRGCKATPDDAAREAEEFGWSLYFGGPETIRLLQKYKYKELTTLDLALHYCIELPRPLGRIDRWRYESCRKEAALAPTPQGVSVGQQVCREKFGQ